MRPAAGAEGWVFVALAGSLSLAALAGLEVGSGWQAGLLAVLVTLLGLPHGALDIEVARLAGLWHDLGGWLRFGCAYVLVVGLAIGFWLAAPGPALAIFLAMSAWHFAGDWRDRLPPILRLAVGGSVVSLPALFHVADVTQVFGLLVPAASAKVIAESLELLAVPFLVGAVGSALRSGHPRTALEIVAIVVAAAALPPLVYFIAYFCFLHSPRHLIEAGAELAIGNLRDLVRRTWPIVAITCLGAMAAAALLPAAPLSTVAIKVVFIGLFGLTVPHMLLIEVWVGRLVIRHRR